MHRRFKGIRATSKSPPPNKRNKGREGKIREFFQHRSCLLTFSFPFPRSSRIEAAFSPTKKPTISNIRNSVSRFVQMWKDRFGGTPFVETENGRKLGKESFRMERTIPIYKLMSMMIYAAICNNEKLAKVFRI